jgi:hypothetical protein
VLVQPASVHVSPGPQQSKKPSWTPLMTRGQYSLTTSQKFASSSQYPPTTPFRQRKHSPMAQREHGSGQQVRGVTQTPEELLLQHSWMQWQFP